MPQPTMFKKDSPNCHDEVDHSPFSNLGKTEWQERSGYDAYPGAVYCSYCGSIDPLTFIDLVASQYATRVETADWKYGWPHKTYLDITNPEPAKITYLGGASGGDPKAEHPDMVAHADLTPEQVEILKRDGAMYDDEPDYPRWYRFGRRDTIHAKFYSVHLKDLGELTEEQIDKIGRRTGIRWLVDVDPDGSARLAYRAYVPE